MSIIRVKESISAATRIRTDTMSLHDPSQSTIQSQYNCLNLAFDAHSLLMNVSQMQCKLLKNLVLSLLDTSEDSDDLRRQLGLEAKELDHSVESIKCQGYAIEGLQGVKQKLLDVSSALRTEFFWNSPTRPPLSLAGPSDLPPKWYANHPDIGGVAKSANIPAGSCMDLLVRSIDLVDQCGELQQAALKDLTIGLMNNDNDEPTMLSQGHVHVALRELQDILVHVVRQMQSELPRATSPMTTLASKS